jgi:hypothetical protein
MLKGAGFQPEDAVYEGLFLDGVRHGHGVFQCGAETYEGEFEFDRCHGDANTDADRQHQY